MHEEELKIVSLKKWWSIGEERRELIAIPLSFKALVAAKVLSDLGMVAVTAFTLVRKT